MVQVISGSLRHRRLVSPKGDTTRPTTSQVRQAVFNICQNEVEGAAFLDICAGSGSMGIEAISRGANQAIFIDSNRNAVIAIHENIKALDIAHSAKVMSGDAILCLKRLIKQESTFQIAYFDPPYSPKSKLNPFVATVLELLDSSNLIAPQGLLFVEERVLDINLNTFSLHSKRKFGDSLLYCFQRQ